VLEKIYLFYYFILFYLIGLVFYFIF